jgi:hypothetical protein
MTGFSPIFSGGAPGAALLAMRMATAAAVSVAAVRYPLPDAWLPVAAVPLALCLLAGLFTRAAGVLGALLLGICAAEAGGPAGAFVALHAVEALALALLGAGAYSVDARLFGRKVIRLEDPADPFG